MKRSAQKHTHASLLLGAVLFFGLGCRPQAEEQNPSVSASSTKKVFKAPEFELVDIQGKKFALKDFRGKVVFIDFWATWCPPCVMSVPEVEKLHQDYHGKNVQLLSISVDSSEAPVRRFMTTHKMSDRVALAGDSGVDINYGVQGVPAFFLIDQKGNLAKIWEGYNPAMTASWRKEIDRLLN